MVPKEKATIFGTRNEDKPWWTMVKASVIRFLNWSFCFAFVTNGYALWPPYSLLWYRKMLYNYFVWFSLEAWVTTIGGIVVRSWMWIKQMRIQTSDLWSYMFWFTPTDSSRIKVIETLSVSENACSFCSCILLRTVGVRRPEIFLNTVLRLPTWTNKLPDASTILSAWDPNLLW